MLLEVASLLLSVESTSLRFLLESRNKMCSIMEPDIVLKLFACRGSSCVNIILWALRPKVSLHSSTFSKSTIAKFDSGQLILSPVSRHFVFSPFLNLHVFTWCLFHMRIHNSVAQFPLSYSHLWLWFGHYYPDYLLQLSYEQSSSPFALIPLLLANFRVVVSWPLFIEL